MTRVLLIYRDPAEAAERAARLRALGLDAAPYQSLGAQGFRSISQDPPQVILIDLIRQPSYGKTMALLLSERKSLASIPVVFVEGDPEKTQQVRAVLPDAGYAAWAKVPAAIEKAARQGPREGVRVRPPQTPLLRKLGIGVESGVALRGAPASFALPGARIVPRVNDADVVLLFFRNAAALGRELPGMGGLMRPGRRVWVLWPKKTSGEASDLTMPAIRAMAIAAGLVDYKVCAVDATWSAMMLARKRRGPSPRSGRE